MFDLARTGLLLLISVAMINNCYSTRVEDNNEENFEAEKVLVSATLSNKYSFTNFRVENGKENSTMGFSVSPIRRFTDKNFTGCYLQDEFFESYHRVVFFTMDFVNSQIQVKCSSSWNYLWIYETNYTKEVAWELEPIKMRKIKTDEKYSYYDFQFYIKLGAPDNALYFHNCDGNEISYDLEYELIPSNDDFPSRDYKSPIYDVFSIVMYIVMCCCFFILGLYRVYIYKISQNTLKSFHYVLLIIVFLEALYYLLESIKCSLTDYTLLLPEKDLSIEPFIDVTKGLIFCCIIVLAVQGWIYVKNIFGRIEKYLVMSMLIVQLALRTVVNFEYENVEPKSIFGIAVSDYEFLFSPVIVIYFLIRRADWRKDVAVKNLKKFQLFRFVCLMISIVFYFVSDTLLIMKYHFEIYNDYVFLTITLICKFLFYAILLHKVQPKFISEITALKTHGELLPLSAKFKQ